MGTASILQRPGQSYAPRVAPNQRMLKTNKYQDIEYKVSQLNAVSGDAASIVDATGPAVHTLIQHRGDYTFRNAATASALLLQAAALNISGANVAGGSGTDVVSINIARGANSPLPIRTLWTGTKSQLTNGAVIQLPQEVIILFFGDALTLTIAGGVTPNGALIQTTVITRQLDNFVNLTGG